jgi:hypothetical protein
MFEKEVLKKICGPHDGIGWFGIFHNEELRDLCGSRSVFRVVKWRR